MFKMDLEKAEEPEIKLPVSVGSLIKQENSRKISISALLTMPKPLTVCERLLLNHTKTPGFLAPGGEEFNAGPERRLDCSELLWNKVVLKYKGDRETF